MNEGADVNFQDEEIKFSPLHWAAEKNLSLAFNYLLDKGADPDLVDKWGRTARQIRQLANPALVDKARARADQLMNKVKESLKDLPL